MLTKFKSKLFTYAEEDFFDEVDEFIKMLDDECYEAGDYGYKKLIAKFLHAVCLRFALLGSCLSFFFGALLTLLLLR